MVLLRNSRSAIVLASAAALSLTATPAMARHWHSRDRGIDGGDLLAGVLIIGGIAAIAAAASKSSRESRAPDYPYRQDAEPQGGVPSDEDYRNWRDYRDRSSGYDQPGPGEYGADRSDDDYSGRGDYRGAEDWRSTGSTDRAVDVCVDELERGDRSVEDVDGVNRDGEGWRVDGRLRDGRSFTCTADGEGRVRRLAVDGQLMI